jgi:ubiquitin thioesterase protein OTUB1
MAAEAFAPTDDEILEQQAAINEAQIVSHPLVSGAVPISSLFAAHAENQTFLRKLQSLESSHSHVRATRPDGSCFYRAFVTSMAEYFIANSVSAPSGAVAGSSVGEAQEAYNKLLSTVESSCDALLALGHSEWTVPDFKDAMVDFLLALPGWSHDALVAFLNTNDSTWVVYYTRLLASLYIRSHPEEYTPVILGLHPECAAAEDVLKAFVEAHVEPTAVDADQPAVSALVSQTGIRLEIAYLDSRTQQQGSAAAAGSCSGGVPSAAAGFAGGAVSLDTEKPTFHSFSAPGSQAGAPHITLLYRPGHYDVLYSTAALPPDASFEMGVAASAGV